MMLMHAPHNCKWEVWIDRKIRGMKFRMLNSEFKLSGRGFVLKFKTLAITDRSWDYSFILSYTFSIIGIGETEFMFSPSSSGPRPRAMPTSCVT